MLENSGVNICISDCVSKQFIIVQFGLQDSISIGERGPSNPSWATSDDEWLRHARRSNIRLIKAINLRPRINHGGRDPPSFWNLLRL